MFGPEVVIVGGGHNITVLRRFMIKIHEKIGNEDLGVVIEDDVWIGSRAMILRGVCVRRGSVVAAGTFVTKSVSPYAIVMGNPAHVVKFRWDVKTIITHEEELYPPEKCFSRKNLELWQPEMRMLPPRRAASV